MMEDTWSNKINHRVKGLKRIITPYQAVFFKLDNIILMTPKLEKLINNSLVSEKYKDDIENYLKFLESNPFINIKSEEFRKIRQEKFSNIQTMLLRKFKYKSPIHHRINIITYYLIVNFLIYLLQMFVPINWSLGYFFASLILVYAIALFLDMNNKRKGRVIIPD